jgi:hypothetical protein
MSITRRAAALRGPGDGGAWGDGMAAAELSAAVALLLVPVLLLVVSLPVWSERQHAAVVAAREAALVTARAYPDDRSADAIVRARHVAALHGVPVDDVVVEIDADLRRGGLVTATVHVAMPAVSLPGRAPIGSWTWTTAHSVRIDDYRSR